jgi:gliding motility-associated-like protein
MNKNLKHIKRNAKKIEGIKLYLKRNLNNTVYLLQTMKKGVLFNEIKNISICIGSLFLCLLSNSLFAQKEGNIWYFGKKAGLDFNTNPPSILNNGMLDTEEGCLSIADKTTGQLLFYSDGSLIWGKNHQLMPSMPVGGLGGHYSSTQSGIVIPDPANANKYYVFSVDEHAGNPLVWAKIDMTLNGGNGDVVSSKNVLLSQPCEKITAFGNCFTNEYWVMGHKFNSDSFFAWKVNANGVSAPVTTVIGSFITGVVSATIGYMKFSPNGKKLAIAHMLPINKVEIFDFDGTTGKLSNPILDTFKGAYGLSFSPNSKLLYVCSNTRIIQYDVSSNQSAQTIASRNTITSGIKQYGALQNAVNGKMYHSGNALFTAIGSAYLNTISNPNLYGTACNFQDSTQFLGAGASIEGLPSIVENFLVGQSLLNIPTNLTFCPGQTITFPIPNEINVVSLSPTTGFTFNADTSAILFTPTAITNYKLTYTAKGYCNFLDSVVFTIKPEAVNAQFDINPAISITPATFNLNNRSTNATLFDWYENGSLFSNQISPTVIKNDTGKYCFTLIASNNSGCADTAENCATAENADLGIFIPSAFSPNGDGINNTFKAIYDYRIVFESMAVYNRWGNRVFFTRNPYEDWDGKFKGVECDTGVYFYIFEFRKRNTTEKRLLKGDLHLIK